MSENGEQEVINEQFFMSDTIGALGLALAKAQGVMTGAKKDSRNPHLKNKYADLASVNEATREPLSKNELAVTQLLENDTKSVTVRTMLIHSSGEWLMSTCSLPFEAHKGINIAQAMGSMISYLRRYSKSAITGLHQEDDDGASVSQPPIDKPQPEAEPTEEQQLELVRLKTEAENNCAHLNNLENWYKKHKPEIEALPQKLSKELKGHIAVLKKQLEPEQK
jgi:hypothetical protein